MSLNAQLASFKKEIADTTTRNLHHSRPASHAPTRTATPKPPSEPSKRTHDTAFAASAPSNTREGTKAAQEAASSRQTGSELMTQVWTAIKYLKEKSPQAIAFDALISYLSLPVDAQRNVPLIKRALRESERATFIPRAAGGKEKDSFRYAPLYPITNAEELKTFLGGLATRSASGIPVKDLKDGWPDCNAEIERLEKEGFVLVARWKKDNTPRIIYPDSPSYHIVNAATGLPKKVDADFVELWGKTKVPAGEGEVRLELEKAGLTPTSAVREVRIGGDTRRKEKKRGMRKGAKTTNAHMLGILKDYSKR